MKHTQHKRSDCPINFALETFDDPWSLLIIRDIVYFGKKTYGEFLASEEGMATNILASRLAHLEQQGLLVKKPSEQDKRKEEYVLTETGLDLILSWWRWRTGVLSTTHTPLPLRPGLP